MSHIIENLTGELKVLSSRRVFQCSGDGDGSLGSVLLMDNIFNESLSIHREVFLIN